MKSPSSTQGRNVWSCDDQHFISEIQGGGLNVIQTRSAIQDDGGILVARCLDNSAHLRFTHCFSSLAIFWGGQQHNAVTHRETRLVELTTSYILPYIDEVGHRAPGPGSTVGCQVTVTQVEIYEARRFPASELTCQEKCE